MPTTWISRGDKRILYADFRDCDTEAEMESVLTGIDARAFATEAEAIAYLVSK